MRYPKNSPRDLMLTFIPRFFHGNLTLICGRRVARQFAESGFLINTGAKCVNYENCTELHRKIFFFCSLGGSAKILDRAEERVWVGFGECQLWIRVGAKEGASFR